MKKTKKKLQLIKESVRSLTAEELLNAGGASGVACGDTTFLSCGGTCVEATCWC